MVLRAAYSERQSTLYLLRARGLNVRLRQFEHASLTAGSDEAHCDEDGKQELQAYEDDGNNVDDEIQPHPAHVHAL
jgi:hypothetical protein